jgi:integrase
VQLAQSTYTARELAELRRCSLDTIYRWVADGTLQPLPRKPGAPLRFPASVVESATEATGMGARYDTKRGQWFVDFWHAHPDGTRERIRRDSPVNTRRGAQAFERETRGKVAAGEWRVEEPTTLRAFSRDFLAWARANPKRSTADRYDLMLRVHLLPHWGRWRLAVIDTASIEAYKSVKLDSGLAKKTVNNHLALLSKMLHTAHEWRLVRAAPRVPVFKLPKLADQEYRWLSREEASKLVAAADGYWRAMIVVALNTGLRMGELQALRWSDVDLKLGKLTVRRSWWDGHFDTPKSGKPREVPINATARAALDSHPPLLRCELVFHTRTGTAIDKPDLHRGLARVCARAGVERVGWHVMRHTFASWLVQAGVPMRQVQALLGHSTIQMTERYAHLSPATGADAVAALDALAKDKATIRQ